MTEIRIQKLLASLGIGSRRSIEQMIKEQKIKLNHKVCELGDKVKPNDTILVNGKKIKVKLEHFETELKMLIYNKPLGEVCSRKDEEGRPTVFDKLPKIKGSKWINIGRLDINTSGLLIFVNDGNVANKLMHPSSEFEREYLVKTSYPVTDKIIAQLKKGVKLEDGFAKFKSIKRKSTDKNDKWFSVVITEGRNREIRRLWESQGISVNKLIRIRFGDISLPQNLRKGSFIEVNSPRTKYDALSSINN